MYVDEQVSAVLSYGAQEWCICNSSQRLSNLGSGNRNVCRYRHQVGVNHALIIVAPRAEGAAGGSE